MYYKNSKEDKNYKPDKYMRQESDFLSEDIDNKVYSKKKPLSIKKQKEIFIEEPKQKGVENFKKAADLTFKLARFTPGPIGYATDIIDIIHGDQSGMAPLIGAVAGKYRKHLSLIDDLAEEFGAKLYKGVQVMSKGIDVVDDSKQLTEKQNDQKYKHKFQAGSSMRVMDIKDFKNGRPLEQGLINVYPEMALAGFVRAGMMGALPSFKNSAISTASGITSRQVKDKLIKGLEQATNTGETINDAVRNSAKAIVTKTSKEVVKRLPEPLKRPAMRTINRGWDMATTYYGINGQIGAINDIKNKP